MRKIHLAIAGHFHEYWQAVIREYRLDDTNSFQNLNSHIAATMESGPQGGVPSCALNRAPDWK